jgi:hypothetical protein
LAGVAENVPSRLSVSATGGIAEGFAQAAGAHNAANKTVMITAYKPRTVFFADFFFVINAPDCSEG